MAEKGIRPKPVVLCILDGWGYSEEGENNAIAQARTPAWDALWEQCPHALLQTSGEAVGLPKGQMGNSEVGHMNIGSGRIVMQELPRIDHAIADGSLKNNPALQKHINTLKESGGICHLMGLASDGGVHAHILHIVTLARFISKAGVKVAIHAFLDGRDTPPRSAEEYIAQLQNAIKDMPDVALATLCGRYYAMDRDNRWERVERAYNAMAKAEGTRVEKAHQALEISYEDGKGDEFVEPMVLGDYKGMHDGDGVLMANFRGDRAREILLALLDPMFDGFSRTPVRFAAALGMVEYSEHHNRFIKTLFPARPLSNILGEVLSEAGLTQLRIAETEKYAHVTFFFNGGMEEVFPGEERILIPSPKVATYDIQPEMSAPEVTAELEDAIEAEKFDFIVVNYANTDMVGHTGNIEAAIKAVQAVDVALGVLRDAVEEKGGILMITADHGNAEQMVDPYTHGIHTAHTVGPVPLVLAGVRDVRLEDGRLCDVAPTLLALMGLPKPGEMTGVSLLAQPLDT